VPSVQASALSDHVRRMFVAAGEPERRSPAEREANGIPLDDATWRQLADAATAAGVAPLTP